MELNARLAELLKLKNDGLLSDSEYVTLVELAESKSLALVEEASTVVTSSDSGITAAQKKREWKFVGLFLAVLAVGFFGIRMLGATDPTESKEYKDLLGAKMQLEKDINDFQTALNSLPDVTDDVPVVTAEITDYQAKISRWKAAIQMLIDKGLS